MMDYISKNILSNNYNTYIKLCSIYDNNNKINDIYYKILSILDPYVYINNGFSTRNLENFKFVKTKYKLYRINDLLIDSNISILQYQPFLSYFFQTYEEIIKFKLIDKNKSISILEITNLPVMADEMNSWGVRKEGL